MSKSTTAISDFEDLTQTQDMHSSNQVTQEFVSFGEIEYEPFGLAEALSDPFLSCPPLLPDYAAQ